MEPGPYWAAPPVPDAAGRFTENLGQWDEDVRFVAEGPTARAGLCPDGVVHQVTGPDGGHRVKVAFTADGPVEPYGVDDLGYPTSYFMGNDPDRWVTKAR
ncbi:MAG: hypothetical protein GWN18_01545, partial [Thermoplasmata archaeon]|nr:hypothetical protein [Thermoplasmata archaeon]NIS18639.1 hypothetical protein [Thermoplasmata archaeon]NIV77443.1 hypothetical protein [Thermoplasmata archaeon]NIW81273.1 hypothetical protein [Thermoplasmata archaeon]NIW87481.1 hypothetical protein [Thermoplasmata archaeon]